MNPNLDSLESNLGCLQALQFSISQILFKLLKREKKGRDIKKQDLGLGEGLSRQAVVCHPVLLFQ